VQVGVTTVQLLVVARLEDYVDAEALLRDSDAAEPPYWAHLWPGSRALARLLATEVDCRGRRGVDIGCGLGLAGIAAAKRGAAVTMIDTDHAALCFTRASAALNGCSVAVFQSDLREPALRGRFDLCLAADVTYDPALQTALARFVAERLARGGRAWCAESVRTLDRGLHQACEQLGLRTAAYESREFEEGHDVPVRITEIRWP
jgi:predicted nicotinamide N-methyase